MSLNLMSSSSAPDVVAASSGRSAPGFVSSTSGGATSSSSTGGGGKSLLMDHSSVGKTTAAMQAMTLDSMLPRENGLASGRDLSATTVMSHGQSSAAMAKPKASAASASSPGKSAAACAHPSSSGRTGSSSSTSSPSSSSTSAPMQTARIDPHSVAAQVAMPGDVFHAASSASHSLTDLMMGKTLGTGTFGRVRLVRNRRSSDWYALKIMTIGEVVRLKQTEHVKSEKNILLKIKHPFIVDLKWTFHDRRFLYMLLEFVVGGELFSYLRAVGRFHTGAASFYAAEIVSALDHLHGHSIIYRDLKPENLLIDAQGHIKITDFGFAKELSDQIFTWTLCGTPEYLAPEIIQNRGHGKAVDWWALGILIYEMLVGYPPFFDDTPFGIYEKILSGVIDYPRFLENASKDIIKKLLVGDRTKRLGSMRGATEDVKKHRFFRDFDFVKLRDRKCKPPFVPTSPSSTADYAANFDDYEEEDLSKVPPVASAELSQFSDF